MQAAIKKAALQEDSTDLLQHQFITVLFYYLRITTSFYYSIVLLPQDNDIVLLKYCFIAPG